MTKKLPRRTVSMAKRAGKLAKDASDLDLIDGAIGTEAERPAASTALLLIGFALTMVSVLALVLAYQMVFGSVNTDHSMLPDGYRASTGLSTATAYVDAGTDGDPAAGTDGDPADIGVDVGVDASTVPEPEPSATVYDGRSLFASARTAEPVILKVACPVGTVQISTGPSPVDTVCIQGELVAGQAVPPTVQQVIIFGPNAPTVGNTLVPPGLHRQEDEAIAFVGVPDLLVCVHIEQEPVRVE